MMRGPQKIIFILSRNCYTLNIHFRRERHSSVIMKLDEVRIDETRNAVVRREGSVVQLACSHKSHRRCFFLFSDAFSRTRTQRGGSPRPNLLQLQHERRYTDPVLATANVRWRLFHLLSRFSLPRLGATLRRLGITCRVWFVDIFIIPPTDDDDGSTHRADYANATPRSQLFSFLRMREMRGRGGRSFNNRGCAARVKVQYRISEERYCNVRSEKSFYTANIKHSRTSEISALRNPVNNHRSVVINTLQSVIISSKTSFRRNLKPMMKLLKYFQLKKL